MDVKTSLEKTELLMPFCDNPEQISKIQESIKESIKIISNFPAEKREFRTVLVPTLVNKSDIEKIATLLPKDASWQFAQFRNENCLDATYNDISPYIEKEALELVEHAKTFIPAANLR